MSESKPEAKLALNIGAGLTHSVTLPDGTLIAGVTLAEVKVGAQDRPTMIVHVIEFDVHKECGP